MAGKELEDVKNGGDDLAPIDDGSGKNKKKMILMIAVPLVLLVGGGAAAYFTGMLDKLMGKGETTEAAAEGGDAKAEHGDAQKGGGEKGEGGEIAFLKIPDMIVNLNSDDGSARYLRLSVQLELESQVDLAAVEKVLPRVVDQFQTYLRELRVQDLRGSKGIYRLQLELLNRVNQAAAPTQVKDVLFQEILIQ